jgi:hypothetical protein
MIETRKILQESHFNTNTDQLLDLQLPRQYISPVKALGLRPWQYVSLTKDAYLCPWQYVSLTKEVCLSILGSMCL